jgi:hypothetical protein
MPPFLPVSPNESIVTGGVETFSPAATPIVSGGFQTDAGPMPATSNPFESVSTVPIGQDPDATAASNPITTPLNSNGDPVKVTGCFAPFGAPSGTAIDPALLNSPQQFGMNPGIGLYPETSYTGSNLKVMIEVANGGSGGIIARSSKQLVELTTLTVSVHRVKSPAVAMGYINVKGWARGRRTIAGTMVLTQFTTDVLSTFLTANAFTSDLSKDSTYVKVDQLPPFNITLLFGDEYGKASFRRILGLEFVTSGDVYSIQDMLSEQTISYVAADFTPLTPINQQILNVAAPSLPAVTTQRTVGDCLWSSNPSAPPSQLTQVFVR